MVDPWYWIILHPNRQIFELVTPSLISCMLCFPVDLPPNGVPVGIASWYSQLVQPIGAWKVTSVRPSTSHWAWCTLAISHWSQSAPPVARRWRCAVETVAGPSSRSPGTQQRGSANDSPLCWPSFPMPSVPLCWLSERMQIIEKNTEMLTTSPKKSPPKFHPDITKHISMY